MIKKQVLVGTVACRDKKSYRLDCTDHLSTLYLFTIILAWSTSCYSGKQPCSSYRKLTAEVVTHLIWLILAGDLCVSNTVFLLCFLFTGTTSGHM